MARQMTQEDRRRIDHLLVAGMTINDIAADLGRNKTTVLHEIIGRAVPCDRGYGCSNTLCAKFETFTRTKGYGGNPKRLFRCTPGCFEACPEFVERMCGRLRAASHFRSGGSGARSGPAPRRARRKASARGAEPSGPVELRVGGAGARARIRSGLTCGADAHS